jgi:hypothetical protein
MTVQLAIAGVLAGDRNADRFRNCHVRDVVEQRRRRATNGHVISSPTDLRIVSRNGLAELQWQTRGRLDQLCRGVSRDPRLYKRGDCL